MEAEHTNNNEKKTLVAIILTVITMIAEIIFGYTTHSMALLADGFHMGTHFLALTLTLTSCRLMIRTIVSFQILVSPLPSCIRIVAF